MSYQAQINDCGRTIATKLRDALTLAALAMPELRHLYAPIRIAKKLEIGTEILLDAGVAKSLRFRETAPREGRAFGGQTRDPNS